MNECVSDTATTKRSSRGPRDDIANEGSGFGGKNKVFRHQLIFENRTASGLSTFRCCLSRLFLLAKLFPRMKKHFSVCNFNSANKKLAEKWKLNAQLTLSDAMLLLVFTIRLAAKFINFSSSTRVESSSEKFSLFDRAKGKVTKVEASKKLLKVDMNEHKYLLASVALAPR